MSGPYCQLNNHWHLDLCGLYVGENVLKGVTLKPSESISNMLKGCICILSAINVVVLQPLQHLAHHRGIKVTGLELLAQGGFKALAKQRMDDCSLIHRHALFRSVM